MGKEKTTGKGPNKVAALITYVLALICLLLGLFLPFGNGAETTVGNMLGLQIPAAVNALYPLEFLKSIAEKYPFAYNYPVNFADKFTLDFGAVFVLLYALVTVMGIVALIPVIANAASKKSKKNVALRAASFIEALAVAVLSGLLIFVISDALSPTGKGLEALTNWSLFAAFGGTLLVLTVQALIYKKGSGVIKFALALISAAALFITLFDITKALPFLADKLPAIGNLPYALYGSSFEFMGETITLPIQAINTITMLFSGTYPAAADGIQNFILFLAGTVTFYTVCANFVFDAMGLGKKTNVAMLITNLVRYIIQLAAVAVIIIVAAITEGATIGIMSIAIAAFALISLIINTIRLAVYKPRRRKQAQAKKAKAAKEPVAVAAVEEKPAKESKKERKEREKAEKLAAKQAQREAEEAEKQTKKAETAQQKQEAKEVAAPVAHTAVEEPLNYASENDVDNPAFYRPVIYKGPVDEFIRLLNNEQKVEFARVFIERQSGPLNGIPEYVIGGDNGKFFSSVFIYFAKIRDLISDGLMNEIYKQANVMR